MAFQLLHHHLALLLQDHTLFYILYTAIQIALVLHQKEDCINRRVNLYLISFPCAVNISVHFYGAVPVKRI